MTHEELTYLIAGCRRQDAHCQRQLFVGMYDFGMRIAARYARNRQDTEEIANDGFVKMFRYISNYRSEVPFELWLRRIIINCGIDHYRKYQRGERIVPPKAPPSRNKGEAKLDSEYLLTLIWQLPPQYRMVFVLHVMEGYNHQEIADQLGIARGTSKSNLAKARQKLQALLAVHELKMTPHGQ